MTRARRHLVLSHGRGRRGRASPRHPSPFFEEARAAAGAEVEEVGEAARARAAGRGAPSATPPSSRPRCGPRAAVADGAADAAALEARAAEARGPRAGRRARAAALRAAAPAPRRCRRRRGRRARGWSSARAPSRPTAAARCATASRWSTGCRARRARRGRSGWRRTRRWRRTTAPAAPAATATRWCGGSRSPLQREGVADDRRGPPGDGPRPRGAAGVPRADGPQRAPGRWRWSATSRSPWGRTGCTGAIDRDRRPPRRRPPARGLQDRQSPRAAGARWRRRRPGAAALHARRPRGVAHRAARGHARPHPRRRHPRRAPGGERRRRWSVEAGARGGRGDRRRPLRAAPLVGVPQPATSPSSARRRTGDAALGRWRRGRPWRACTPCGARSGGCRGRASRSWR